MELQLAFQENRQKYKTKQEALYHALKAFLAEGKLGYLSRLPSSRELAARYGMSRGTVNQVYVLLEEEGFVTSRVGSGTYVTYRRSIYADLPRQAPAPVAFSEWGARVVELAQGSEAAAEPDDGIRFVPDGIAAGRGDESAILWNRFLKERLRQSRRGETRNRQESGGSPLQAELSRYLQRSRGIEAAPEQIVVVNNTAKAITLLVQLLVDPGDQVVADPTCFPELDGAVWAAGGRIIPAKRDSHGLLPEKWAARLLFTENARSSPTGALTSERRRRVLHWAEQNGAVIAELAGDDELPARGRPAEPLKKMDRFGRVVYIGRLSPRAVPDMDIGYVLLPEALHAPFVKAKELYAPYRPGDLYFHQTLAAFLGSGMYEKQLRKLKRLDGRMSQMLAREMAGALNEVWEPLPRANGPRLYAKWRRSLPEWETFRRQCRQAGVFWTDASSYFAEAAPVACFDCSCLNEESIRRGVGIMSRVWREMQRLAGLR